MGIEVLYFSELKELTGKDREVLSLKKASFNELLDFLLTAYPSLEPVLCEKKSRNLKSRINIVINDSIVQKKDRKNLALKDGDKIAFLLPLSGG